MKKIKETLLYKILREPYRCLAFLPMIFLNMIINIEEIMRDRELGIETSERFRLRDAGRYEYYDYQPTRYRTIQKIIDYLNMGPEDVFVDLGCGKGRVVFMAAFGNPKKTVGVDAVKELTDIAKSNLHAIKEPHAPVEFFCIDAAKFDVNEGTVFHMFNPFGCNTVKAVLENIKASIITRPRDIRIVYHLPFHSDLLNQEKWLELEKEMDNGNILIWHNKAER